MRELKFSLCGSIYIGSTHQTFKKIMNSHFSYLRHLLENGQKSDSFAAHFKQYFRSTTSRMDLNNCITFKVVNQINPIGTMV